MSTSKSAYKPPPPSAGKHFQQPPTPTPTNHTITAAFEPATIPDSHTQNGKRIKVLSALFGIFLKLKCVTTLDIQHQYHPHQPLTAQLKLELEKRCSYRHQRINVAQAAVQDWGWGGRRGRGCFGCQLKARTPAEKEMCTFKVRKTGKGHRGIVDRLKPRVTPPQPCRARSWRALQAERTRAFECYLTSRSV